MSLSFVGAADAAAATVNLPAFTAGDLAIVFAFRDGSTTAPTLPAGWTGIDTGSTGSGGTAGSHRTGYRVLVGGDTTTGAWTNATDIAVMIVRGQHASAPIDQSSANGGATNQLAYAAASAFIDQGGDAWVLGFGASRTATDVSSKAVTGWTTRSTGTNTAIGYHTHEGVQSQALANYAATVNAATTWRTSSIVVRAAHASSITPSVLAQGVKTIDSTTAATASFTEPSGSEMLAIVAHWAGADVRPAPTATGWTQIGTIDQGAGYRITMLRKTGAGATGAVTFSCGTDVQSAWEWIIYSLPGAGTAGGAFGTPVTQQGSAVASVSMSMLAALKDSNSIMFAAIATGVSENVTPTAGDSTEDRDDITADFGTFEAHRKIQERLARFSWTTATAYSAIAVEVMTASATNAPAATATASGVADNATPKIEPSAGTATASGVADNAAPKVDASAGQAAATGQAFDATVTTEPHVDAPAGQAAATGQAFDATVTIDAPAGDAAATGVAFDATVFTGVGALAEAAAATGQAFDATAKIDAPAGQAAATGVADNATPKVEPRAGAASASGQGFDATATTISPPEVGRVLMPGDSVGWQVAGVEDDYGLSAFAAQFGITPSPRGLKSKGFDVVNVSIPGSGPAREDTLYPLTWADTHLLGQLIDIYNPEKVVIALHGNATVWSDASQTAPEPYGTLRHYLLTISGFLDVLEDARSRRADDDIVVVAGARVGPDVQGWDWANALTAISRSILDDVMPAYPAVHTVDWGDLDPWDARVRTPDTIHVTDEGASIIANRIAAELTGVTPGAATAPPPAEMMMAAAPLPGGPLPIPIAPAVVVTDRAPLVTARYRKTVTESHKAVIKMQVRPLDLPDVLATMRLKGGSVEWSRDDPIARSAEIEVVEDESGNALSGSDGADLFRAFLTDVQVWRGVEYPDHTQEVESLALLKITDHTFDAGVHTLTCFDPSIRARQNLERNLAIAAGTPVKDAATALIQARAPTMALALPDTGDVTPQLMIADSANGWEEAWKLYRSCGFYLEVDRYGTAVATSVVAAPANVAEWTFAEDDRDVFATQPSRSLKHENVPNHIIVRGTAPNVSGVRGEAFDTDPDSPTFVGRIGHIIKTIPDERVTTNEQATRAAVLLLSRVLGTAEENEGEIVPNPAIVLDQTHRLDRPSIGLQSMSLVDHLTFPLGIGDTMPIKWRRGVRSDAELLATVLP